MSDCKAEGEHWEEVREHGGLLLCRKHRLILMTGGSIKIDSVIDTKGWKWFIGKTS